MSKVYMAGLCLLLGCAKTAASDGWNGAVLTWLAAHSEDNEAPDWRPWDSYSQAEQDEYVMALKELVDEAVARRWPVHLQVTFDHVAFMNGLGGRPELGRKTCLQYTQDSGFVFWDGRAHPESDHNAVDATWAIADALAGGEHTGILGSSDSTSDWNGYVAGVTDQRTEHYTILIQGGTPGHPEGESHEGGIQVATELGGDKDQTVIWSGNATDIDAEIGVCNAVATGLLDVAITRIHFNAGKPADGSQTFLRTPEGRTIFEQVDEIIGGVTEDAAARIEVISLGEVAYRWGTLGPGTTYTYDADAYP